jgi:hypothetical protein
MSDELPNATNVTVVRSGRSVFVAIEFDSDDDAMRIASQFLTKREPLTIHPPKAGPIRIVSTDTRRR